MTIRTLLAAAGAAALTLAATGAAQAANLLGDTLHAYYVYPDDGALLEDLGTFTVTGGGHIFSEGYEVTADQLIVTVDPTGVFWLPANFNGLQFVDETASGPVITGLTLNAGATTAAAAAAGALASWTDHSFEVNFQNEQWGPNEKAVFDIQFGAGGKGGSTVPEPAAWAMLITGLFGAGSVLRAQRRATAPVRAG
jgi:hypothetical protein